MKKFSLYFTTACLLGIFFFGLKTISNENTYTSVRKYLLKKEVTQTVSGSGTIQTTTGGTSTGTATPTVGDVTPPTIAITNYKNADSVTAENVDINVQVSDDTTSTDKIVVTGNGGHQLAKGFNPIVVSATDEAGNIATTYIVLERK